MVESLEMKDKVVRSPKYLHGLLCQFVVSALIAVPSIVLGQLLGFRKTRDKIIDTEFVIDGPRFDDVL